MLIDPSWLYTVGYFIFGNLLFGLAEYGIHRFLHIKPKAKARYDKLIHKTHNLHHRLRLGSTTLRMIEDIGAASMGLLISSWYLRFTLLQNVFWGGFISGYAMYVVYHDSTHHDSPNGIADSNGRYFHALHHGGDGQRNYTTNFGVTTVTWDWVLNTLDNKITFRLRGIVPAAVPLCAPYSFRYCVIRNKAKSDSPSDIDECGSYISGYVHELDKTNENISDSVETGYTLSESEENQVLSADNALI